MKESERRGESRRRLEEREEAPNAQQGGIVARNEREETEGMRSKRRAEEAKGKTKEKERSGEERRQERRITGARRE